MHEIILKSYLVGGAVRDRILGIQNSDKDYVVVGATEQEMLTAGFVKVGSFFPVFLHPKTQEEYALARTEKKTSVGYQGFFCQYHPSVTLADDLKRRDLTINAIAFDGENYIDPFNGLADLKNRILRPVSKAFKEDAIRVLRLARFKAKLPNFKLHDSFYLFIQDMKQSGELNSLQPERVRTEMEKAFKESKPSLFFETLNVLGVLEVVFPELHALIHVAHRKNNPKADAFTHTMMVLDAARQQGADNTCLYAALLHNLGKGIRRHIASATNSVTLVKKFLKRFGISKNTTFVLSYTLYHLQVVCCKEMPYEQVIDLLDSLKIKKTTDTNFQNLITCSKAYTLDHMNADHSQTDYLAKCVQTIEKLDFFEITKNVENANKAAYVKQAKISALKSGS